MSLMLAVGTIITVRATATNAIIIEDIDGSFVFTSQGTFSETPALLGQSLGVGNIVTTGDNSSVQLRLNDDTLVILDANSQIAVSSSRNGFSSITVQRGSIFVNSSSQNSNSGLEIRATNNVIGIIGSMYVVSLEHDATVTVVALDGQSNVNGVTFPPRTIVSVGDDIVLHEFALEVMNLFTLQVIWNFQERLLIREHVTPEMVRSVPSFIDQRWREARVRNANTTDDNRLCAWEAINAPPPTPEPSPTPIPSLPEDPRPSTPAALRFIRP